MINSWQEVIASDWLWLVLGALLIGIEKAGIKGLSMVAVSIYALILGGKASSGLLLILFMLADLFAVRYYFTAARFKVIGMLLGPAIMGVFIGGMLGQYIEDVLFKDIIAFIILFSLALMTWPQFYSYVNTTAQNRLLSRAIGFLTGFGTMIANVSSPILAIYLLALRLSKREFIGTVVWFFFIVNFLKLPFHIWSWQTIQFSTLKLALSAIPVIALGFLFGLVLVRKIAEKNFRRLIIGVTLMAALRLLLGNG